ncbi:MAG TPA: metal ABC transporter permease [Thermoclostridium caenicola]|uniref:Zinc transport system permease protein n=1 Tax=Thermoclostridium caenicola TaxID=659425 RepID=A0A1M6B0R2_9FIRM|nr:metal ABC transporter permease [Thermoclostridium caenicola]SHI42300.1 zinc transport system permease protein [Thermoclostridium caenicola]HOK43915.1 metal ABC transporter permease [Thermoclostridium caenicola]HOL84581.1 metal ABC transporter permease [Thermoclostridium caenicola]HOP72543.1 metal ABC transporter permease [Thermoclostridium caenicola]HPO77246.1 metal ABC transporter permease [Thermoclostridium caenicola]
MELWYNLVDLLPFEWAEPGRMLFMKNALLAIILLAPIFGTLGTMIVNNQMAFFSDALGHGAFTGIVIGGLAGFLQPMWSAVAFSLVFSVGISVVHHKTRMSSDTIIGVFSSFAVAAGIFLATLGGKSFAKLNSYLVGSILSITPSEIGIIAVILVLVLIYWYFFFNRLLFASINPVLARSRGVRTFWLETLFSMAIAVLVTVSMSWIGLLVINSFLVLPAAAARNLARNQRQYHLIAVAISLFSGVSGLIASYYTETASGATIVLITAVIFLLTLLARRRSA